jgi:hemoglobin
MQPSIARTTFVVVALSTVVQSGALTAQNTSSGRLSLYQRLGGHAVISAVVDDFLGRLDTDPELMPFVGDLNGTKAAAIREHLIEFICAETGGPCLYTGRDMQSVHQGIQIAAAHFQAVIRHFLEALDDQQVGPQEKQEVLGMLAKLSAYVVAR